MDFDPCKLLLQRDREGKILVHACCAPCCSSIIKRLVKTDLEPTVFFYNPNIYPHEEYQKRKFEVIRYTVKLGVPFVDMDDGQELWFAAIKGHEHDPERGERCGLCFELRLGKTASYAAQNNFNVFTTSLGISRWKDLEQVTRAGIKAANLFSGLTYWPMDWRKGGGVEMMARIAEEEKFYRQDYCGCIYSLENSIKKKAERRENNHG